MTYKSILAVLAMLIGSISLQSCGDDDSDGGFMAPDEDPSTFSRLTDITIGGEGAAEIAAFDPITDQLFVVNNADESKIDVINFANPASMNVTASINVSTYGGGVNSVAVNGAYLAAAIEAETATDNGQVVVFNIADLSEAAVIPVGSLPDMVTFSPDGQFILVANEGEPSDDYTIDPNGSVSIIEVDGFQVVTLEFTAFNSQEEALEANGFRVTGKNADLASDVEPEYIAVSEDSRTAFVALQENNGLAVINLENKSISALVGLGTKDYSASGNAFDPSDRDDAEAFRTVPANILGVYMPDAIDAFTVNGTNYVISANEGDGREYFYDADEATCNANGDDFDEDDGCLSFTDETRIEDVTLDPSAFPDAATLQQEENFGRLKMMLTNGDTDGDGDFDQIYSYGARSFSIWSTSGDLIYDSGNEIEDAIMKAGLYADGRSDDKGVEPEGVVTGVVNGRTIAFIGLERVDAVAVYDISTPASPQFLSILETGDAPEGMVFIDAEESPTGNSILIVTCEDDGTVWAYSPSLNM
ncbi:MAG: choice-of-anchor I family protein [Bacteroidota bacterium]